MPDFVDVGDDEGAILGREGGKIALYGNEPVRKPIITAVSTSSVTLAYLRSRIGKLEQALALLGIIAFDGQAGPDVPDEPTPQSYAVIYGSGVFGYYGDDEATYQDPDSGVTEGSLYGSLYIRYGDIIAVY